MIERLAELPKDSRLLLMQARRVEAAKDQLVRSQLSGTSIKLSVEDANFVLSIRQVTLLALRDLVEARDPTFPDFTDGEIRLMNDSLPVSSWR